MKRHQIPIQDLTTQLDALLTAWTRRSELAETLGNYAYVSRTIQFDNWQSMTDEDLRTYLMVMLPCVSSMINKHPEWLCCPASRIDSEDVVEAHSVEGKLPFRVWYTLHRESLRVRVCIDCFCCKVESVLP